MQNYAIYESGNVLGDRGGARAGARWMRLNRFGIAYEGKTGLSKSEFAWAA
jgi:hypothetical protein